MKKNIYAGLLLLIVLSAKAQTDFKDDNVLYKTIYPNDLNKFIKAHPKAVLIDVRTPGEFSDSSQFGHLNIGRLKNAINVEIDSISAKLESLKKYSDEPVILYCSHSQRSRRFSKILVKNKFKQVYNLNGGMSWMVQATEKEFPGKKDMIISSSSYNTISADEAVNMLKENNDNLILDVRPIIQFEGKDTLEENNIGRIKNAINIPREDIKDKLVKLEEYKNKKILVYDLNGKESGSAAKYLTENGFTKVYHVLGGLSAFIGKEKASIKTRQDLLVNTPSYNILNVKETIDFLSINTDLLILDVRTKDEFNNKSDVPRKNLGHFKNAINLPAAEFDSRIHEFLKFKKSRVLLYGEYVGAAKYCKKLKELGFENVNLVYGGLWNVISTSANVKGFDDIKPLMENYDGFY
jgi:rhodanese-related sulfurtransferase